MKITSEDLNLLGLMKLQDYATKNNECLATLILFRKDMIEGLKVGLSKRDLKKLLVVTALPEDMNKKRAKEAMKVVFKTIDVNLYK